MGTDSSDDEWLISLIRCRKPGQIKPCEPPSAGSGSSPVPSKPHVLLSTGSGSSSVPVEPQVLSPSEIGFLSGPVEPQRQPSTESGSSLDHMEPVTDWSLYEPAEDEWANSLERRYFGRLERTYEPTSGGFCLDQVKPVADWSQHGQPVDDHRQQQQQQLQPRPPHGVSYNLLSRVKFPTESRLIAAAHDLTIRIAVHFPGLGYHVGITRDPHYRFDNRTNHYFIWASRWEASVQFSPS